MRRFSGLIASWLDDNACSAYTAAPTFEVSYQTLYNWAQGRCVPMRPMRPRIARILSVSESFLDDAIDAELAGAAHDSDDSQDGAA